jgi:2-iminoacetate synthase
MNREKRYALMADGFYSVLTHWTGRAPWSALERFGPAEVQAALDTADPGPEGLLALLSPAAGPFLEHLARKAQSLTLRHFGRAVQLFTPLYLANFCTNRCLYCGFNARRHIERHLLGPEEVEAEARAIATTGLRRILALTGDAPAKTGAAYLADCVAILARHFPSVGIEVPSMTVDEYALVVAAGVDGMTMFQETYNEPLYAMLHPAGPKRDFGFRLDAPERAVLGGVRAVNLGALLGLDDWRRDVFLTALHAAYLLRRYPHLEVSLSFPRLRPCGEKPDSREEREFRPLDVSDADFVQAITAFRIFLPQAGITLSTREPAFLRDRLIPLGITRISAGVSTAVGGHSVRQDEDNAPQFAISDPRSVEEMAEAIEAAGYQPVYTDWLLPGAGQGELSAALCSALGGKAPASRLPGGTTS